MRALKSLRAIKLTCEPQRAVAESEKGWLPIRLGRPNTEPAVVWTDMRDSPCSAVMERVASPLGGCTGRVGGLPDGRGRGLRRRMMGVARFSSA